MSGDVVKQLLEIMHDHGVHLDISHSPSYVRNVGKADLRRIERFEEWCSSFFSSIVVLPSPGLCLWFHECTLLIGVIVY